MKVKGWLLLGLVALLFVGCAKRRAEKQAEEDDQLIQQYLSDNGLTATKTSSGLYYIIDVQGTGASCESTSDVRVAYTGYYLDGTLFDQSTAAGITFNLQNVIKGWTEGIPFFKEGGSGLLLIPSALAYGHNPPSGVRADAVMIFEVELLEVL